MNGRPLGIYLYCLFRGDEAPRISRDGIEPGAPVFVQKIGGIAAVVSRVSLADFTDDESVKDIRWVGPRALAHEAVIEALAAQRPVFPLRFGTIFSSRQALIDRLHPHQGTITGFLDRISGKDEWALKGLFDPDAAAAFPLPEPLQREQREIERMSPGKQYLARLRFKNRVASVSTTRRKAEWETLLDTLTRRFADYVRRKVLSGDLSGTGLEMVFNLAFLLSRNDLNEFRSRVEESRQRLEKTGLQLASSGPWPPYSFCPALGGGI